MAACNSDSEAALSPTPLAADRSRSRAQSEFQRLLSYALKVLAKREHSVVELRRKLNTKAGAGNAGSASAGAAADEDSAVDSCAVDRSADNSSSDNSSSDNSSADSRESDQKGSAGSTAEHIDQVIDALLLDGSLSDERFAAEYVRQRVNKGYGPIRIRMDLLERGVSDRLAEYELTQPAQFWQEQAAKVCRGKFGDLGNLQNPEDDASEFISEGMAVGNAELATGELATSEQAAREAAQQRWNRCARFLSQRGFPADLIYRTLEGRLFS